ncbi:hypothetical protein [Natronoglycomyces albus]|uniref:Uncharacterized protein n=1 Tax=Natronoglycomyces albus TaxID=2811108 RepID=A0A895XR21_9ACTN|nr:hypothetical protein [Natronoglycomyces albus]QSB05605.1 hypothetical protein JQS30_01350 [Natronoglycomyces albus]
MATGIGVDPSQLDAASDKVSAAAEAAQAAKDYALEADGDPWIWGLPGLVLAGPYFSAASIVHSIYAGIPDALSGAAERLHADAEAYRECEDENCAELDKACGELE